MHWFTYTILLAGVGLVACSLKYEKILHQALLNSYNRDVRPESAHEQPVHVTYDMVLQSLTSLDVKQQILEINAFITLSWYDPQLVWNVTVMDGIEHIRIGSEFIWTPDIVLYNNADDRKYFHFEIYKTKALVEYNGTVTWNAPVTWKVSCSCDVTWFPFDEQVCSMQFGSWTYSQSQLAIHIKEEFGTQEHFLGGEFLIANGEWKITEVKNKNENVSFHCCPEAFSTITYELHLSRMSLYYMLYILLPLFSLVLLFLLVFHLEDGERMGFGITVLLSITVYLLVISEKLPEKSDKYPVLGMCFIVEFYFLCLGLVLSALNIKLSKRSSRPPGFFVELTDSIFRRSRDEEQHENEEEVPTKENRIGKDAEEVFIKPKERVANNEEDWKRIARFLDYVCTASLLFVIVMTPVIVAAALKK